MLPLNLNNNTYPVSVAQTSVSINLTPEDAQGTSVLIYNSGANPVFAVSARGAAATAVYPTSVPLPGKIIPAGFEILFTKNAYDDYISFISASGTNQVFVGV